MFKIEDIKRQHAGKKIAILGNGPSARDWTGKYYDFSKAYSHIWVVNGGQIHHPTATLEFMMDDHLGPALEKAGIPQDVRDKYIKKSKIPIITSCDYVGFGALTEYPLREIVEYHQTAYFGETLSYMVAFALWCGVKSIHFHGTDYFNCKPAERASTEYWCGIARMFKGAPRDGGVEIRVNPQSHFLSPQIDGINVHVPYFYGYIPDTFPFKLEFHEDGTPDIHFGDPEREAEVREAKKRLLRERYGEEKTTTA
jgi:hypothetical protein